MYDDMTLISAKLIGHFIAYLFIHILFSVFHICC